MDMLSDMLRIYKNDLVEEKSKIKLKRIKFMDIIFFYKLLLLLLQYLHKFGMDGFFTKEVLK